MPQVVALNPQNTPCDMWEYALDGRGVAVHRVRLPNGKMRTRNAVRIFWEIRFAACLLPRTVLVMLCGNKRCVEPLHASVLSSREAAQRPRRSRSDLKGSCPCHRRRPALSTLGTQSIDHPWAHGKGVPPLCRSHQAR